MQKIDLGLGLSTTLTSEDKNGDFETSLKIKNKDCILVYDGLGAKIQNISTNDRPGRSQGIVIKFYPKDMLDYPRLWMFKGFFL